MTKKKNKKKAKKKFNVEDVFNAGEKGIMEKTNEIEKKILKGG